MAAASNRNYLSIALATKGYFVGAENGVQQFWGCSRRYL